MKSSIGHWGILVLLLAVPAVGQESAKERLTELEQYKQLKQLKEKDLQQESAKLKRLFENRRVIVTLNTKIGKETEIEGFIGGVAEYAGQKFVKLDSSNVGYPTIALIPGSSIAAIRLKN